MKITSLHIQNFKSVQELELSDVDDVLILVGRNNAGKSVILDAIRAVTGDYAVSFEDFHSASGNIIIKMTIELAAADLKYMHSNGVVGKFKHFDLWKKNFCQKLPSFEEGQDGGGTFAFEYVYSRDGIVRYRDSTKKNNSYIKHILPAIYYIDHYKNRRDIKEDLEMLQQDGGIKAMRENKCLFDRARKCNQCFDCIGIRKILRN